MIRTWIDCRPCAPAQGAGSGAETGRLAEPSASVHPICSLGTKPEDCSSHPLTSSNQARAVRVCVDFGLGAEVLNILGSHVGEPFFHSRHTCCQRRLRVRPLAPGLIDTEREGLLGQLLFIGVVLRIREEGGRNAVSCSAGVII
jgi:hypothetical protein